MNAYFKLLKSIALTAILFFPLSTGVALASPSRNYISTARPEPRALNRQDGGVMGEQADRGSAQNGGSDRAQNSRDSDRATDRADRLFQEGIEQFVRGEFREALQTYQRVLEIRRERGDKKGEAETLTRMGEAHIGLSAYETALEVLERALTLHREVNNPRGEGETLNAIGYGYRKLGNYSQARELHDRALAIAEEIGARAVAGEALHNLAALAADEGDYPEALELYRKALAIREEVGDKRDLGRTLNNIGGVYFRLGDYRQSGQFFRRALRIRREIGDRAGVARLLSNLGLLQRQLGDYDSAIAYFQEALPILREIGDREGAGRTLNSLGVLYENRGQYFNALDAYREAASLAGEIGDIASLGNALENVGGTYYHLGRYIPALESYRQALALRRAIGDKAGIGNSLNNLGGLYHIVGQYDRALEFLEQALELRREVRDKAGEAATLNSIGVVYDSSDAPERALEAYRQALAIAREIGDKGAMGKNMDGMGGAFLELGDYDEALRSYQEALGISETLGDRALMGRIRNHLSRVYFTRGEHGTALEFLQQAAAIFDEIGDRPAAAIILSNIGRVLARQNQPILAIVFYKQALNSIEEIRQQLRQGSEGFAPLPLEQQQSYTETVADIHRALADLLLKKGRALEAKQVLDLLKVQEIDDYLRNMQVSEPFAMEVLPQEREVLAEYAALQDKAVEVGKELAALQSIPPEELDPEQSEQIAALTEIQQQLAANFNEFASSPEVEEMERQLGEISGGESLSLDSFQRLQEQLQEIEQNAVLLYPLVLEDRLEIVLVTPYAPPIHRAVPVSRARLQETILAFRNGLTNPRSQTQISQVLEPAQQLYRWLIEPIEAELAQAEAETIIYGPDGQLRYVPLAALHDGDRWLVESFAVNNITAASLTTFGSEENNDATPAPLNSDANNSDPLPMRILAGAFSAGNHRFELGNISLNFSGLPFAGLEVENLASLIPNTTKLYNEAFSPEATIPQMNEYDIVHLATHAAFISGEPEQSFILFGNGDRVTLRDVENWSLPNVSLVVLSACQTGLGGVLGNGEEILGFGYQMQLAGARASLASLWSVDDGGTQALMDAFYRALKSKDAEMNSGLTKAEALRNAQIAALSSGQYSHPFYWASFILIGNGL